MPEKSNTIDYSDIDNTIIFQKLRPRKKRIFFVVKVSKKHNLPICCPIHGAVEWCKENDINPRKMSVEDEVAFKLRWL